MWSLSTSHLLCAVSAGVRFQLVSTPAERALGCTQAGGLRRLRQLVNRSMYNLDVCTAGLQLVSVLLRWLQPSAPTPAPAVLSEILNLLGILGGYRATAQELRTLFGLLQSTLSPPAAPSLPMRRAGHASSDQLLRLLIRSLLLGSGLGLGLGRAIGLG